MAMSYPPQHEPPARPRPQWPWIVVAFVAAIAAAVGITLALTVGGDNTTVSGTQTTAESAGRSVPIHADTIAACRSLPEDPAIAEFWREAGNGSVSAIVAARARAAVIQLGRFTTDPDIDPTVTAAMSSAVLEVVQMTGEPIDVEAFGDAITPVVDACQALEVDMGLPE